MKAETYVTSKEVGTEYGYQLTSDDGEFIMDMVLGEEYEVKDDIEKQFEKHRPLVTMMAAAPDLLKVLECALTMIEHVVEDGYHYEGSTEIINEAKTMIAKAKGENQ